jgi:hypothetical protein
MGAKNKNFDDQIFKLKRQQIEISSNLTLKKELKNRHDWMLRHGCIISK